MFTPIVTPVQKTPHILKLKLEKELKHTVDLDIIKTVDELTDWINGLVIVEKWNGKLQISFDS